MNHDAIKTHDFADDQLPPVAVLEHLKLHDARMKDAAKPLALIKAAYETRFWKWMADHTKGEKYSLGGVDRIEVNKLQPAIDDYLAALYPRRLESVLQRTVTTTGDPDRAQAVINKWVNDLKMRQRLNGAIAQALCYRGAAAKVGYDAGPEPVLQRVWCRVFPYWELVIDDSVHDPDDIRFIGHVSYKPRKEVEEKYGITLSGTERADFLSGTTTGAKSSKVEKARASRTGSKDGQANADASAFVRVLELCNLVDSIDEDGHVFDGRLEIYLLDEGQGDLDPTRPVWMGPLPLVRPDGRPMPHIVPLYFRTEIEHPFRGLSYAERLLPQIVEINATRSFLSQMSRRDARAYLAKDGALNDENLSALEQGKDGAIIRVKADFKGRLQDALAPIEHGRMSANLDETMALAENDLNNAKTTPTSTLGFVKNVTAEAVKATVGHSESEFGRHAEALDNFLIAILERFLAACVAAMYDVGDDSEGQDETPHSVGDAAEGERESPEQDRQNLLFLPGRPGPRLESEPPPGEEGEDLVDHLANDGSEMDEADAAIVESEGLTLSVDAAPSPENAKSEATILLFDTNDELIEVTAADLDSDFTIGFQETGRSPIANVDLRESLVKLAPMMGEFFKMMLEGGPMAAYAYGMLEVLHSKYNLPPSLHPDALLAKAKEVSAHPLYEAPAPAKGGAPGGGSSGGAPAGAAVEEAPSGETAVAEFLSLLPQMTPRQALSELLDLVQDPPTQDLIERALRLPDEAAQAEALAVILQHLGLPVPGGPATAEGGPPPAPNAPPPQAPPPTGGVPAPPVR